MRARCRGAVTDDELIAAARDRLPSEAPPPAGADEFAEAERQLGFSLPPLLRRMYAEVSKGGWGPGYGANGLIGGARADLESGVVEWYRSMRDGGPDPEDPALARLAGGPRCHLPLGLRHLVVCRLQFPGRTSHSL